MSDHPPSPAPPGDPPAEQWFLVTNQGRATRCENEAKARSIASNWDEAYPEDAPHRVVRYVLPSAERARLRAVVEGMRLLAPAHHFEIGSVVNQRRGWNAALDAVLAAMGET